MKRLIALLVMLSMVSMIAPAEGSTSPSKPAETPPAKLYTEAESLAAVDAALEEAIPKAVQAAVAQKEGELAAEKKTSADLRLDRDAEAKDARTARGWAAAIAIIEAIIGCLLFVFGAWVGLTLTP